MKIQRVDFKNLKGSSDSIVLGPATLIYGRNFTGKTTITDAIKLALLGYLPGLDKTAAGVFELASGDDLKAAVILDNGQAVGHVWERKAGRISKRDSVPLDWPEQPVAVLDASAYFGLSDRGKIEYLFRATAVEGNIIDELERLRASVGPDLAREIVARGNGANSIQKWLDEAVTSAEALRSEASATATRLRALQQGTVQLGDYSNPPPVDLPARIEEKGLALEAARGKLRDLERGQRDALTDNPDSERASREAGKLSGLKSSRQQLEREREAAAESWRKRLAFKGVCPMCGSDSENWRAGAEKMRDEQLTGFERRAQSLIEETDRVRTLVDNLGAKAERADARTRKKYAAAIEDAELVVAELTQAVADLNKQQYRYGEYVAERRRLDEARTKVDEYERREKALRSAKLGLVARKAALLEKTFGPIMATLAIFTKGLLVAPLEFREGELGYVRNGGGWVPYRTFSGTEQAVAFAAFQAALASRAPVRIAILDELGRLDTPNKARLFANIGAALKAGVVDQFIGIDTERMTPVAPEFTVIERGPRHALD
jgi:hypothetical protein